MHQPPPVDQSTFESHAQYNLQATEDVYDDHPDVEEKKHHAKIPKKPNYRPKPLRWPFIVCMVLLLSMLMGLVIFARETMPNSDSTATIEPRHYLKARQNSSSAGKPPSSAEPNPSPSKVSSPQVPATSTPAAIPNTPTASEPKKPSEPASPPEKSSVAPASNTEPQVLSSVPNTPTPAAVIPSSNVKLPTTSELKQPSSPASAPVQSTAAPASKTDLQVLSSALPSSNKEKEAPSVTGSPTIAENTEARNKILQSASSTQTEKPSETTRIATTGESSKSIQTTISSIISGSMKATSSENADITKTSSSISQTAAKSEVTKQMKGNPGSTASDPNGDASSTPDVSGQRKAPPAGLTSSSSKSSSPSSRPLASDESIEVIKSEFTTTITKPASTFTYSTVILTNITSTFTTIFETTLPGTTRETTITKIITTGVTKTIKTTYASSNSLTTIIVPETHTRTDTISDEKTTYLETATKTVGRVTTSTVAIPESTGYKTTVQTTEATIITTAHEYGPPTVSSVTSVVITSGPSAITTVATSTATGQVYVSVGTTEITRVITIAPGSKGQDDNPPTPVTQVITSVFGAKVVTVVDTGVPQKIVTNEVGVYTVAFTPRPETFVTRNGGEETQMVITVTPSPNAVYMAVQTTIAGTPTVVIVESTPGATGIFKETAGFKPVSLTLISQVGGSTGVFTTTDEPETIRTIINGQETTIVRTPPPRVFTSVVGGTPTTIEIVTTPTDTMPLSFTVITSIGGSLSTIVSTPSPTTIVTTISGKLSTITSTPEPTTRLSTIKPSTATITTVSESTATGSPAIIITQIEKFAFTNGDYFLGKFFPVILAVLITIPLRIIDLNAKLYQPFFALAQEEGSLGKNSMTLQFDGWKGFLAPFEVLMQGHPVPFITTLVVWSSSLLAPLATEAIGMKLHGKCRITAIDGCGIQLGVSTVSAHALVALLAFIIVLLLVLLFFLRNWETGLHANPWSIAGISSLTRNGEIRSRQIDFKASKKAMREKKYWIGYFENSHGRDEYGIIYYDDSAQSLHATASGALQSDDEFNDAYQRDAQKRRKSVPFIALTYWWRLAFLFFLIALLIIILYYHITLGVRTSFKDFMDSQTFGVRFFFAALGVTIIFCWQSIFISIAVISPYYHMGRRSQPPEKSILLTRPTNGFYGIYAAIIQGDVVLMLAAFMAILAEFLPILLANVPYNLTQTLNSHNVCTIMSVSIMAFMILTLAASLFIKWPEMPVDPRSIAGAMYYVNESRMLDDFEGLSKLNSEQREKRVKELGRRYFYGAVTGTHGRRMGVESVESVEDTAYTGHQWFLPRTQERHENEHGPAHEQEHQQEHQRSQEANERELEMI
ncbi:hypothetical protein EsH8_VIII_000185 [Colletotrichum jinshuiense]